MTSNSTEPNETTGLLGSASAPDNTKLSASRSQPLRLITRPSILCLLFLMIITNFAYYHLLAPRLRVLELNICRTYYLNHDPSVITHGRQWPGYDVEESLYKHSAIQQKLSSLRGIGVALDAVVVLSLSVPYGYLADRYDRRTIYSLSHAGLILSTVWLIIVCTFYESFSINAVLTTSAFLVIGGGSYVQNAIAITMGVDMTGTKNSSTSLYWLLAMYYLGYICGNGLAPVTMQILGLPFAIALSGWFIALILTWLMPYDQQATQVTEADGLIDIDADAETSGNGSGKILKKLRIVASDAFAYIRSHTELVILIALFPLMAVRGPVIEMILPYVSKRYHWSLGQAGFLDAISGMIGLILGVFVLPAPVDYLKRKRTFTSIQADSVVFQYSVVALGLGALIVAIAPKIGIMIPGYIIYATGAGGRMAILSFATALVLQHQVARLNTVIVTSEVPADLSISPLMWHLWSIALEKEEPAALGIPFYVVTGLMGVIGAIFVYNIHGLSACHQPSERNTEE